MIFNDDKSFGVEFLVGRFFFSDHLPKGIAWKDGDRVVFISYRKIKKENQKAHSITIFPFLFIFGVNLC